MSEKIVQLNEAVIKSERKELVHGSVEEALNELPEAETKELTPSYPVRTQWAAPRLLQRAL